MFGLTIPSSSNDFLVDQKFNKLNSKVLSFWTAFGQGRTIVSGQGFYSIGNFLFQYKPKVAQKYKLVISWSGKTNKSQYLAFQYLNALNIKFFHQFDRQGSPCGRGVEKWSNLELQLLRKSTSPTMSFQLFQRIFSLISKDENFLSWTFENLSESKLEKYNEQSKHSGPSTPHFNVAFQSKFNHIKIEVPKVKIIMQNTSSLSYSFKSKISNFLSASRSASLKKVKIRTQTQKNFSMIFQLWVMLAFYNNQKHKLQMPQQRKYAKISLQKRQKLVKLILEQGKSISQAARKFMVKPSTAKLILKRFKETGSHFLKKMPNYAGSRQNRHQQQQIQSLEENQQQHSDVVQVNNAENICQAKVQLQNEVKVQEWIVPYAPYAPGFFFYYTY